MNEIRNQPSLRLFGSLLALTHLLTCYFWLEDTGNYISYFTDPLPLCWPFLPACEAWPRFSPLALFSVFTVYALLAGISGLLFLFPKWLKPAYLLLAAATAIKIGLFLADYRLSGNYHYMHFWVLAAYFFIPSKALAIRFLLVAFYLGAGVLKLNKEWLTGAALPSKVFPQGWLLQVACAYVVILELVLVFGLFARRRWIFWATLAQLFLFHAVSFFVVGFYYPSLLFCFLALFLMREFESPGDFTPQRARELGRGARAFLGLFVALQVVPWILGGDRAVDGRGRMIALNMFDAGTECDFVVTARFQERTLRLSPQYSGRLQPRLYCDPHVLLADARHRCRELGRVPAFTGLDVALRSKRKTDPEFQQIFDFKDFCADPKHVNVFGLIR